MQLSISLDFKLLMAFTVIHAANALVATTLETIMFRLRPLNLAPLLIETINHYNHVINPR